MEIYKNSKALFSIEKPHGGEHMVKVRNIFGDIYSGKQGKAGVFATWKGRQYRRSYVIPANPRTPAQRAVRSSFKNAVDAWHNFSALQKEAYNYLATPYQISGFNLWVSRYQKAATSGQPLPSEPREGIKQIGTASAAKSTPLTASAGPHALQGPVQIGSVTFNAGTSGVNPVAIAYIDRGLIEFTQNVSGTVTIDCQAGGRVITGEKIATNPSAGDKVYTEWWPLNFKSVHIYVNGVEVDAIEIDAANGQAYFTKTAPADTSASLDYVSYTPIANAKLEIYKSGTSQLVWRGYSDAAGFLEVAATVEDEPYDFVLSAAGYTAVTRIAINAQEATQEELIIMT